MPRLGKEVAHFKPPQAPDNLSLRGQRVSLVPLSVQSHAKPLYNAFSQDRGNVGWLYLPYGPFETFEAFEHWLSAFEGSSDPYFFVITCAQSGCAMGLAAYLRVQPEAASIEVGHIHFSKQMQRTTMATEAMFLMMQWAFEQGYRRYEWKCNSFNERSRNAAQRFGFSFEGIFRQAAVIKGRNRDTAWFSVIDREWPALKSCYETFLAESNFDSQGVAQVPLSSLTRGLLSRKDDRRDLYSDAAPAEVSAPQDEDERWMRHALKLAQTAADNGEVPVGAILVRDGEVIGEGANKPITLCDPTAHAEIIALRAACAHDNNYRLPGTVMYVTIEPCSMCVGAMVHARIDRLVFGAREPKAGAVISKNRLLEHAAMNSKIVYSEGVLQQECSELMSGFFSARRGKAEDRHSH